MFADISVMEESFFDFQVMTNDIYFYFFSSELSSTITTTQIFLSITVKSVIRQQFLLKFDWLQEDSDSDVDEELKQDFVEDGATETDKVVILI